MNELRKTSVRLWQYIRPHRVIFAVVLSLGALMSLFATAATALAKELFDKGFLPGNQDFLVKVCLFFVLLYALHGLCRYFHMYLLIFTAEKITVQLQQDLQQKYMRLSYRFHQGSDSGGHLSRILNDVNTIKWGVTILADVVREPLLVIGLLGWIIWLDPKLTLMIFVIAPIIIVALGSLGRSVRKYSYAQQETLEKFTSVLKETFDGLRVIQSFNLENKLQDRLKNVSNLYLEARKKIISRQESAGPMTEILAVIAFSGTCLYMGLKVSSGQAGMGHFISYVAALGMLQNPIKKLQDAYVRLQQTLAAVERIFSVLEDPREVPVLKNGKLFPENFQTIEFRNISFQYDNRKVVQNFQLNVRRGEVIALVGESGSGKSTIMNLLERFIDPDEGAILIDGVDLRQMDLTDLRNNIALVTQDVFLFNESILESIHSDRAVQSVTAETAAEMANAAQFIQQRSSGYQTLVGERGQNLSGGERQRISIARAIYKSAPILILDEATSALDSTSEVEVQKGLDRLMEGRTTFVIAHRLSTVTKADRIIVMDQGLIVEAGRHEELLQKKGRYLGFVELQRL